MQNVVGLFILCLMASHVSAKSIVYSETRFGKDKRGCGCIQVYEPVCGADGETHTNSGCAECAGVEVACSGECPCGNIACTCIDIYDPVCGEDGVTYGNDCLANCEGVPIQCEGKCPCKKDTCICPKIFAPVCGVDGNTYGNECLAKCAGVPVDPQKHSSNCCKEGIVQCFAAPCSVTTCSTYPDAKCIDNYCGGCNAVFVKNGAVVSCV